MPFHINFFATWHTMEQKLWSKYVFRLFLCVLLCTLDSASLLITPLSFGIITSDDFSPQSTLKATITLHWKQISYQCSIETSIPNQLYQCTIDQTKQEKIKENYLLNKSEIEIMSEMNEISIQSVVIYHTDNDYHQINEFCVDNLCKDTITASNITIELTKQLDQGFLKHIESTNNPNS